MALTAEEVYREDWEQTSIGSDGNELDIFQRNSICLNLTGPGYDLSCTWVAKLCQDGRITCDLFTSFDDKRIVAISEDLAWQASHKLAVIQSYLDSIGTMGKIHIRSQMPGTWAGAVHGSFSTYLLDVFRNYRLRKLKNKLLSYYRSYSVFLHAFSP